MKDNNLISVDEAAMMLDRSPQWVRRLLRLKALRGRQYAIRGKWLVERNSVEEFIDLSRRAG